MLRRRSSNYSSSHEEGERVDPQRRSVRRNSSLDSLDDNSDQLYGNMRSNRAARRLDNEPQDSQTRSNWRQAPDTRSGSRTVGDSRTGVGASSRLVDEADNPVPGPSGQCRHNRGKGSGSKRRRRSRSSTPLSSDVDSNHLRKAGSAKKRTKLRIIACMDKENALNIT